MKPGAGRWRVTPQAVYSTAMRIIAGKWRGRPIEAPDTLETRPILDRAKTVLFDMLGTRLAEPGRLPEVAVLDLFAGSGSLGLEALSRGARYCLFVEQSRLATSILRHNLDRLGVLAEGEVQQNEALSCRILPPPRDPESPDQPGTYALVFVDPPYRLLEQRQARPGRAAAADLAGRRPHDRPRSGHHRSSPGPPPRRHG